MKRVSKLSFEDWILGRVALAECVNDAVLKSNSTVDLEQLDLEVLRSEQIVFGLFDDADRLCCLVVGRYIHYHAKFCSFFVTLAAGALTKYPDLVVKMCEVVHSEGASVVEALAGIAETRLYARVGFAPTGLVLRKQL